MEALYLLIPLSVATVFAAIWVFFTASDHGQFDDLVGPALRLLQDDDSTVDSATGVNDAGVAPEANKATNKAPPTH
jgi:cbb3-type cytochrome oxidase maturation protein